MLVKEMQFLKTRAYNEAIIPLYHSNHGNTFINLTLETFQLYINLELKLNSKN